MTHTRIDPSTEETLALYAVLDWIREQAHDPATTREWIVNQLDQVASNFVVAEMDHSVPQVGDLYQSVRFDNQRRQYIVVGVDHHRTIPGVVSSPAICLKDLVDESKHWVSLFVIRWAFTQVG